MTTLSRSLVLASLLLGGACTVQEVEPPAPSPQTAATPVGEPVTMPDDGEPCDMEAAAPARVRVGEPSSVTVSMSAGGPYKLNEEAPFAVGVDAAASAVSTSKPKYSLSDANVLAPDRVTLEIPFTAHSPGEHALEVHASFGLCSDDECALCKERRKLTTIVD